MTETTRPATWEDVQWVARLLAKHGVKYALIGGYALAAHGIVRFSDDIDILVAPDLDDTRRWVRALAELPDGAAAELAGEATLPRRPEGPTGGALMMGLRPDPAFRGPWRSLPK